MRYCTLAGLILLVLAPTGFTQEKSANPVRNFQDALALASGEERTEQDQRKRLVALAEKIVTLPDLVQVIAQLYDRMLHAQRDQIEWVKDIRFYLAKRAITTVRKALVEKDRVRRLATLVLIGQVAGDRTMTIIRTPHSEPILGPLASDLAKLLQVETDAAVRRVALRALFALQPEPKVLASAFAKSVQGKDIEERRTTILLLGWVITGKGNDTLPAYSRGFARYLADARYLAEVMAALNVALGDSDVKVRRVALEALVLAARRYTNELHSLATLASAQRPDELLGTGEDWVRVKATRLSDLLRVVKAIDSSVTIAVKGLDDKDLECRLAAHKALENIAQARLIIRNLNQKQLTALVNTDKSARPKDEKEDKDPKNKDDLQCYPSQPITSENASLFLTSTQKTDKLPIKKIAPEVFLPTISKANKPLAKSLGDKEIRVRLAALYVLETMAVDAAPAVDALVKALADENRFIRWGAARALLNMAPLGAEKSVPALAKALTDDSVEVRSAAANALARCGPHASPALDALVSALKKGDDLMRSLAARAIGEQGSKAKSARSALIAALVDEKVSVRVAAVESLGKTGPLDDKSKAALVKSMEDSDSEVQLAAAKALLAE